MSRTAPRPTATILLIGNSGVGKTLISQCIAKGEPLQEFLTEVTIQPELLFVDYDLREFGRHRVAFIDPPGARNARELVKSYYRGSDGILAVFDVNEARSYEDLRDDWLPAAGELVGHANVPVLVLANKTDLLLRSAAAARPEKKLARLLETAQRELGTSFPDRLDFVDVVGTSARHWVFPATPSPLDSFVQSLLERKLKDDAAVVRAGGRISLFYRDAPETGREARDGDCGAPTIGSC